MSVSNEGSRKSGGAPSGSSPLFQILLAALSIQSTYGGFIDMDTPLEKRTTKSLVDGSTYHLVMSDEFNTEGRSFTDGHDPMWTALDKSDDDSSSAGGGSQQFYNSSFVTTEDGMLKISTKIGKTTWDRYDHVKKIWKKEHAYYNSGMVQSWEKFCFTGGIVEVDIILPGDPFIGGLWPAVWMLGNLGRATYESSTNNIWPWSFDTCNRTLQPAQTISACNSANHYGMVPGKGRGATEIDIVEIMTGDSGGALPATDPPIELPYADMTLQVAPGIVKNRPQSGAAPVYKDTIGPNGHKMWSANNWYEGLHFAGNTSINPFFYGTYLAETKPGEPVSRTKKQAFQADAVGAAHQLTPSHFNITHTFRVEWQPGPGGRIDWFTHGHRINGSFVMEGDGLGKDWVHAYGITDKILKKATGAQIPIEPTYLIFNTAVSSTWGFPYDVPETCEKCYDCDDPKCACTFAPGFCSMLRETDVAMYIDSIRVYQSRDPVIGLNHSVGCDPPDYPTRGWIKGHEYRYMRNPPFSYDDIHPLRNIQRGGGSCKTDDDCGANIQNLNLTEVFENGNAETSVGRGKCISASNFKGMYSSKERPSRVCECKEGFTGPNCLAEEHIDDTVSAYVEYMKNRLFLHVPDLRLTPFMIFLLVAMVAQAFIYLCFFTNQRKKSFEQIKITSAEKRHLFASSEDRAISGTSI